MALIHAEFFNHRFMRRIFLFLKGNIVYASILLIVALIVLTVFFAIRNQRIMLQTNERIHDADVIIQNVSDLWVGINLMDLGVRGYALTKKDGLLSPFDQALRANPTYLDTIRIFMDKQNLSTSKLDDYIVLNDDYIALCQQMIELTKLDSMNDFISLLEEDRGLALWQSYSAFSTDLVNIQNEIKAEAERSYQAAVNGNIMLQVLLFLVGIPSLYLIYYRIKRHERNIQTLQLGLETNNRKYVCYLCIGRVRTAHIIFQRLKHF